MSKLSDKLKKVTEATSSIKNDKVGSFWVVIKPTEKSILADILFESTIEGIHRQFLGGLKPQEIALLTHNVVEATGLAKKLLAQRK